MGRGPKRHARLAKRREARAGVARSSPGPPRNAKSTGRHRRPTCGYGRGATVQPQLALPRSSKRETAPASVGMRALFRPPSELADPQVARAHVNPCIEQEPASSAFAPHRYRASDLRRRATVVHSAGVAQWQSPSLPSWLCEFDPRHPLRLISAGQMAVSECGGVNRTRSSLVWRVQGARRARRAASRPQHPVPALRVVRKRSTPRVVRVRVTAFARRSSQVRAQVDGFDHSYC